MISSVFVILVLAGFCYIMEYNGQATATPASSSMPYSVQYSAGRFPGHVDRVQSEYGDGAGVIHGSYSFANPKYNYQNMARTSDRNGFHPDFNNYQNTQGLSMNTPAAHIAALRRFALYDRNGNSDTYRSYDYGNEGTSAVDRATDAHLRLYAKIAAQHAAIGAQRANEAYGY